MARNLGGEEEWERWMLINLFGGGHQVEDGALECQEEEGDRRVFGFCQVGKSLGFNQHRGDGGADAL